MKTAAIIIGLLLLTAAACKKSTTPLVQGWRKGSESYKAYTVTRDTARQLLRGWYDSNYDPVTKSIIVRPTGESAEFVILFQRLPAKDGVYKVVTTPLDTGEVHVYVTGSKVTTAGAGANSSWHTATGNGGVYIQVKVTDGKIAAVVPETMAKNMLAANDSLTISASLDED
ncbi:MAG: hypothetical protein V4649_15215 [Bacteroidota bacterium]